jgi:aryl-alcohol dehydrogenase-like predicted oxidoreductase
VSWLRPLGSTGLQVSAIGLGTVKLGRNEGVKYPQHFSIPDDRSAASLLAKARELGINLIDTAPAYGCSEQRLGQLLAGQRDSWLICSKVGEEFEHGQSTFNFSPEHTQKSVERSLLRLATEVIDIVLVHSDGRDLQIIEHLGTLEALADLKKRGLVRAFGMSTKTVTGGLAAAARADVVMLTYNLDYQEEEPVLDECFRQGKGVLVKKALSSGHLSAGYRDPVLASMQLVFAHPATGAAIIGTISEAHLAANVEAAKRALDCD